MQQLREKDESFYRRQSFWMDTVEDSLEPRPALTRRLTADVVIIGAGFTGLWTAYYLKRHAPMLEVVVLEADIAGFGASGRNGGWASAYLAGIENMVADPERREGALRLQQMMIETLPEMARVAADEGIDCHFEQSGHLAAAMVPAHLSRLKAHVRELRELGFSEADCHYLEPGELASKIQIDGALGGLFMAHCAAIQPARLVRGLARAVERQGVHLFEKSPVTGFGPGGVNTEHGSICTEHTLICTEGYSGSLPQMKRKLIPLHSMMVATRPLTAAEKRKLGLRHRTTFNNVNHLVTYGQVTADDRIAFGCRGRYFYDAAVCRTFDPHDPVFEAVRAELLSFFPFLEGIDFTHAWGGALGVSRQLEPMVCFDRDAGLGWSGGYFGDGVAASALAGRTLADLVLGRETDRTHTPWVNPKQIRRLDQGLWEPEPLRWLGVQLRANLMRWTDAAEHRDHPLAPVMQRMLRLAP